MRCSTMTRMSGNGSGGENGRVIAHDFPKAVQTLPCMSHTAAIGMGASGMWPDRMDTRDIPFCSVLPKCLRWHLWAKKTFFFLQNNTKCFKEYRIQRGWKVSCNKDDEKIFELLNGFFLNASLKELFTSVCNCAVFCFISLFYAVVSYLEIT